MNVRVVAGGAAVAAAVLIAGCGEVTRGTPMSDPDYAGISMSTDETTTDETTTDEAVPEVPLPPPPKLEGLAATTCGDYNAMDDAGRLDVMKAIGAGDMVIGFAPEAYKGMADTMCEVSVPTLHVYEAVTGRKGAP